MRVGILTFSNAMNRGAIMQCYALSMKISELGHTPIIISVELPGGKRSLKGKMMSMIFGIIYGTFRRRFYKSKTRIYRSADELKNNPPIADAYIVGSDQVWNRKLISDFGKEAFFLDFVEGKHRRIAYAASLGEDKWENAGAHIRNLVKKFDYISVREDDAIDIIEKQFDVKNVNCVLDPVFLLDNYEELIVPLQSECNDSILGMALHDTPLFAEVVSGMKEKLNKRVEIIGKYPSGDGYQSHPFVGVRKWLGMINSSDLVITNSFHCMALSILLKKDFVAVPSFPGRDSRMLSLMEKLGLSDRFVRDSDEFKNRKDELAEHIDYSAVQPKLDILRKEAIQFLNESLS